MSLAPDCRSELRDLLGRLRDGRLDEAGVGRLDALVAGDPDARRYYLNYVDLCASLHWARMQEAGTSGQWPNASGQWPVASGQIGERGEGRGERGLRVKSRELRVESEGEWPDSPDSQIPTPEIPVINLQISTLNSRLSTLNSWTLSYSVATVLLAIFLLGAWSYTITHPDADSLAVKSNRSATPSREVAKKPSQFIFVGRVSGMVDCQWSDEATATSPGAGVALNRRYALKSGLMEITYDSGAKVILQGPCEYTVESPRGGYLKVGKLTAKVESRESRDESAKPQAANPESPNPRTPNPQSPTPHSPRPSPLFTVRTPTALVEDLGTEFGVEVLQSGETASHVFQGQVRVRIAGSEVRDQGSGNEISKSPNLQISKSEILLSAGQSARVELNGNESPRIIREENKTVSTAFVVHMPRRVPLKLFNTGVGLQEGDEDPHWQIVACGGQPEFKPQQAVVTSTWSRKFQNGGLLPNDPRRSQWISTGGDLPALPYGAVYTFRTVFEIVDAVAESAELRLSFIADNHLRAIRLNGRPLDVPSHDCNPPFDRFVTVNIRDGFVSGNNVLELDVYNGTLDSATGAANPMALRVEISGSVVTGKDYSATPDGDHANTPRKGGLPAKKNGS